MQTFITVLGVTLGYITMGTIVSRVFFVRLLGDKPRRESWGAKNPEYEEAQFLSVVVFLLWPVVLPFMPLFLIWGKTPHEKDQEKIRQMEADNKRMRKLVEDAGLPANVLD